MISKNFISEYCNLVLPSAMDDIAKKHSRDAIMDILEAHIQASNMAIIAVDKNRKIVAINELAARNLNRTEKSMIDHFSFNVLPPNSPLTKADVFNAVKYPSEFILDGRKFISERAPIIIKGHELGVITFSQDVSDAMNSLKIPSEKLRQAVLNESFYDDVIDNSYDGIYITDAKGKTLFVNSAYEKMSGLTKKELVGEYIQALTSSGKISTPLTSEVVSKKQVITRNQTLSSGMDVLITGTPCFDANGNVRHVITNVRDVSELASLSSKLAEEQSRVQLLQSHLLRASNDNNIICSSVAFINVLNLASKLAQMDTSVLLLGETGTGKEIVSQHIHKSSGRVNKPYIKINCGSIPATLLESELFGYVPGAFTGASSKGKPGMFEMADNGTLFLDEIGELPINLQAALLRVLQDGEVTRVGGVKSKKVDVRIIAATNRDLQAMIEEGTFRADLYYRLNVVSIKIPPLRERIEDIKPLAEKTLKDLGQKYGIEKVLSSNFIEYLKAQPWPGNIRELKNYIERQFVLTEGKIINSPASIYTDAPEELPATSPDDVPVDEELPTYAQAKENMERELFSKAMRMGGSTYKAAEILDMSQSTFFRKYKELFPNK